MEDCNLEELSERIRPVVDWADKLALVADNLAQLTGDELDLLQVLDENGADDSASRIKGPELARQAFGKEAGEGKAKSRLAKLVKAGFCGSVTGATGGYWITAEGVKALRRERSER